VPLLEPWWKPHHITRPHFLDGAALALSSPQPDTITSLLPRGWFELAAQDRREDRLARRAAKNPIMKAEQRADKHQ
jgi:hypothetical protein